MRKIQFQNGEYYHIYNRGVDKRKIFMNDKDYLRFLTGLREFNRPESIGSLYELNQLRKRKKKYKKDNWKNRGSASKFNLNLEAEPLNLVEFIAYTLIPNHYHFLVQQVTDKGIEKFIHKISTSHTMYFNQKYKRSGALFQGKYKAIHVKSNHQLIQLSSYIHGNPEVHKISEAENWPWSSYFDYLEKRNGTLCEKKIILDEFQNINEYKNLTDSLIKDFAEQKDEIKESMLEY